MVNKNVLSCLLKDGKEVNAVMLVGRLFHARATVRGVEIALNEQTFFALVGHSRL